MTERLLIFLPLWPIIGWACIYYSTPRWMWKEDRIFGVILGIWCGALAGPFGVLWFRDKEMRR